jgi:hypothetical protein
MVFKPFGILPSLGLAVLTLAACAPEASWNDSDPHYRAPRYGYRYDYDDTYYRDRYDNYRFGNPYSVREREEWERRQYRLRQQERELAAERARLERERRELRRERRQAAERQRKQEQQNKPPEQNDKGAPEKKTGVKSKTSQEP